MPAPASPDVFAQKLDAAMRSASWPVLDRPQGPARRRRELREAIQGLNGEAAALGEARDILLAASSSPGGRSETWGRFLPDAQRFLATARRRGPECVAVIRGQKRQLGKEGSMLTQAMQRASDRMIGLLHEIESLLLFLSADPRRIEYGQERFVLREPIELRLDFDECCELEAASLGVSGVGNDFREAWEGFRQSFSATWHHLALEDDSRLTQDAIDVKRRMLAAVESVEPIAP